MGGGGRILEIRPGRPGQRLRRSALLRGPPTRASAPEDDGARNWGFAVHHRGGEGRAETRCRTAMAGEDCKARLDTLNKAIACYHHLVLTVGGSADSQNLREELQRTRQKAQELAVATCARLTAALRDRSLDAEERAEFERLWVTFSGCLDLLEADMRRALALGTAFPLHTPRRRRRPLVRTGVAGGSAGIAARVQSARSLRRDAETDFDLQDLRALERELLQVGGMIQDMEMKVNVPRWTVQARQSAGTELLSSAGASSMSIDERTGPCDLNKALAAAVFSAVLLVVVALAMCVAKLS
ncbi:Regulator of G-protein signaling 9-binding protein [Galemys pyrenaicus]|uniref:Regulator of G-protein signaling 9-binding protein n=1 Tax=Galemys pyrenaicus TaxID=202257 RepID=A0A8J5ZXU6_GALPY|nr:Regulator of G-protein signaling 9-binding protein [Galemys pyrenaicus]